MKHFRITLLAALLMATAQVSFAQAPGTPGGGAAPAGGTAPTADTGAISNTTTTTTTSVVPNTTTGISDTAVVDVVPVEGEADAALPNTGGAPLAMSLAGLSLAAVAFGFRRKLSA